VHNFDLGVRGDRSISRILLHVHVLAGAAVYGIPALVELPPIPGGLVNSGALHLVGLPPIPGSSNTATRARACWRCCVRYSRSCRASSNTWRSSDLWSIASCWAPSNTWKLEYRYTCTCLLALLCTVFPLLSSFLQYLEV